MTVIFYLQNVTLNLFCQTQSALKMHFEFWQTVQIKLKANFKLDCQFVPFKKQTCTYWGHVFVKNNGFFKQHIIFRHVLLTILLLLWLIGAKGKKTVRSKPHGFWKMKPLMIQVLSLCFMFITKENQLRITWKHFKFAKGILIF